MKTRSIASILLFAVAIAFSSCSGKKEEAKSEDTSQDMHASGTEAAIEAGAPQFTVSDAFQKQLDLRQGKNRGLTPQEWSTEIPS